MPKKLFINILTGLIFFSLTINAMASWLEKSDNTLAEESDVIVYGQYLGESLIHIDDKEFQINLGVLKISKILKGHLSSSFLFIKRYDPAQPLRSDMIFLKPGQTGLWFLNNLSGTQGIYSMTYPGQYKEETESSERLEYWQKTLK